MDSYSVLIRSDLYLEGKSPPLAARSPARLSTYSAVHLYLRIHEHPYR
jgi:hypothetical protein